MRAVEACGECGAPLEAGNAFCDRCGTHGRLPAGGYDEAGAQPVGLVMAGTFGYGIVIVVVAWMAWTGAVGWGWMAGAAGLLGAWFLGAAVASVRRRGRVRR